MKNRHTSFAAALLLTVIAGCTTYRTDYLKPGSSSPTAGKVAVLPFENLTEYPSAGQIAAELTETELFATGRFDILPLAETRRRLKEKNLDPADVLKNERLSVIADLLGVHTLLIGSVSEYRYKRGLGEDPAVGINGRLVVAATGDVLWAASESNTGEGHWFAKRTLNTVAQQTCRRLVQSLIAEAPLDATQASSARR